MSIPHNATFLVRVPIPSREHLAVREPRVVLAGIFIAVLGYFVQNGFRSYNHRQFWNSKTLLAHSLAAVGELAVYYERYCHQGVRTPLRADELAVVLCAVQCVTNMLMVKHLRKGHAYIVRPSYQAGAFLRFSLMWLAYVTQSPVHYHDAIMPLHAFAWTRAFFFVFGTIGDAASFRENVNEDEIYTLAILVGAVIGVGMSQNPYAVAVYVAIVWIIGMVNKWVRGQVDRDTHLNLKHSKVVSLLKAIGLCSFKSSSDEKYRARRINKGLMIGDLKGDCWANPVTSFGHYLPKKDVEGVYCP